MAAAVSIPGNSPANPNRPASPPPIQPISPSTPARSPAILAIQRAAPPSLNGTLDSVVSGRDLVAAHERDHKSVFITEPLYTFLRSPDHTVTACLANSTVDTSVRVIAEHLFGLGNGSFGLWTGESVIRPKPPPTPKGVKRWLERLSLGRKQKHSKLKNKLGAADEGSKGQADSSTAASGCSDESDSDLSTEDHYSRMKLLSPPQLDEVRRCGQWRGAEPSTLFLNIYAQALLSLEKNVLNGMVSPPLMAGCGVVPVTVISHTSDIVQHYADLIINAQREIIFTTNVWEASESSKTIVEAFRTLSQRVADRNGEKIVVKIMYDRGAAEHTGAHQIVSPREYTSADIGLPAPDEIPNVQLEVQNYHIYPVGTFHQKCVVIDRKIALLSSNNVQNRSDVGFMAQYEGPIVQSFYDTTLLAWWTNLNPRPPLVYERIKYPSKLTAADFQFGAENPAVEPKGDLDVLAERTRQKLAEPTFSDSGSIGSGTLGDGVSSTKSRDHNCGPPLQPVLLHKPHDPFPFALVNRTPRGRRGHGDAFVPQNQAWLAGFKFATKSVFLQTPTFSAKPVVAAALDAVRRGVLVEIYADLGYDEKGEISPDGKINRQVAVYMYSQLEEEAEKDRLRIYWYTPKGDTTPIGRTTHTCHIKLMVIDDQIGVQGNGNCDSASWYHAQEINVLVDSPQVCAEWRERLDANQSTAVHGRVCNDGVWRDTDGRSIASVLPTPTPSATPAAVSIASPVPSSPSKSATSLTLGLKRRISRGGK